MENKVRSGVAEDRFTGAIESQTRRSVPLSITLLAAFLDLPGWNLLSIGHDSLNLVPEEFQGTRDSAGEGLLCSNRAKGNQRER
jgi:hypothetical protein